MNDNNAISIIPSENEYSILDKISKLAVPTGYLPQSIKTPQQALIIALKGRELGIPPLQAFAQISVINGRPTMSSELMLSLIYQRYPQAEIHIESSNESCAIEAKRPGSGKSTTFSFTLDDAKRADLLRKDSWVKYPAAMLRARAISAMARALFPECLSGVSYTPEELESVKTVNTTGSEVKTVVARIPAQSSVIATNPPPVASDAVTLNTSKEVTGEGSLSPSIESIVESIRHNQKPKPNYIFNFGKYASKSILDIDPLDLVSYAMFIRKQWSDNPNLPAKKSAQEFMAAYNSMFTEHETKHLCQLKRWAYFPPNEPQNQQQHLDTLEDIPF